MSKWLALVLAALLAGCASPQRFQAPLQQQYQRPAKPPMPWGPFDPTDIPPELRPVFVCFLFSCWLHPRLPYAPALTPTFPNNPKNLLPSTPGLGVLPPPEFDRPYPPDKLFRITATKDEMAALCPNVKTAFITMLGCSYSPRALGNLPAKLKELRGDRDCVIVSPDEALLSATGWGGFAEEIFRHEQAHCWGWPADHPGARPLP
jgi:hypothetical protein